MKHWQQLNDDDRRTVLEITSAKNGLPQLAIEKDWWVTMTLKALSMTRFFSLMSFKGLCIAIHKPLKDTLSA